MLASGYRSFSAAVRIQNDFQTHLVEFFLYLRCMPFITMSKEQCNVYFNEIDSIHLLFLL